jgi:hypothetical protein
MCKRGNPLASEEYTHRHREGILSAITVGFFFILVGIFFIVTPNLVDKITNFFQDIVSVNHIGALPSSIYLPQPADVSAHIAVYSAVEQFSLIWGVFLAAMLVARFLTHSSTRRQAQNLGDIVFWLGTGYLIQAWLVDRQEWFEFWALIVVLLGVSLIGRAIFLALAYAIKK